MKMICLQAKTTAKRDKSADASRIEAVTHAIYDMLADSCSGEMLRFDHLTSLARQYAAVGSA
jgi:hypothetical protein